MAFYMYLPSNSSSTFSPENKISDYHTKLPKKISLEHGRYEVALAEISYVNSVGPFPDE